MEALESLTANQRLALLMVLAGVLFALAVLILLRLRVSPAEKERRRRLKLNILGRMGDGVLTDVQDGSLYYSYSVSGVTYTTAQDAGSLLPPGARALIGPVTLKYLVRNPANSIVICENWSGLRLVSDAAPAALISTSQQETTQNEATA
jgi:hypothetical protein